MTDIALIGEAYGEQEERERVPFIGYSGHLLTQLMEEAGIVRSECFLTNVFNLRPPSNKIEALCGPKSEALQGYPPLVKGKHVREEFVYEIERLGRELMDINPNVVIALGNTAMWAMLGKTATEGLPTFRPIPLVDSRYCPHIIPLLSHASGNSAP
jgi:uracil-DNA glycosylase